MLKNNKLQKDYTMNSEGYQLKLPLNIDCIIPEDDSVRLLSQFVEAMDLTDLYSTYERIRGNQATPRQLLKIMLYAYMNCIYSSRKIETSCKRDINFMYLLEGLPAPDYSTIARFRSLHFAPCSENILSKMSEFLYETGEISGKNIFIDGTKIEANANRYSFVWKKSVSKNLAKRLEKAALFVESCEEHYGLHLVWNNQVTFETLKKLRKKLYLIKEQENVEFVHGIGKRKSILQKDIESLEEHIEKIKEYNEKINKCGERNSFSKTDESATFMRMKEDHMMNGQLKPGYNIQHGVDSEYIVWLTVENKPTDTATLIPFLKSLEEHLSFKYKNIVADAGYESEENYLFIDKNEQLSFIKPSNYEISKTRKYKTDISRIENMDYDAKRDVYICSQGRELLLKNTLKRKSRTGYVSEKSIYACNDCSNCPNKHNCIKGNNCKTPFEERNKTLETSKLFNRYRQEDFERIISEEGCRLRMNRSIQAEGSFADIKEDMGFRRYLCRGTQNVKAESILLAIARNINKLHRKIQNDKLGTHLFELKESA
ncbi:MAG: IS1182 family transposase [Lachnospiraceae bacterium]|nr:IS1182 family transposase [Lachnospiraceae bacterium]